VSTYSRRLEKLQTATRKRNLEGIILVPGPNVRYFTGVHSMLLERLFLLLVPKSGDPQLVAPTLESGPYRQGPFKIAVNSWTDSEGPTQALQTAIKALELRGKWGVDDRTPFRFINLLMNNAKPELTSAEDALQSIREIKDEEEIRHLRRSATILAKSFLEIPSMIKPGIKESELAGRLAQAIRANGADTVDDILVQAGKSSADPHHIASSRRITRNESIVVDVGSAYSGYYADITRTFMVGVSDEFERLYSKVLEAQMAAIKMSKGGVTTGVVDAAARNTLRDNHLDGYFVHRTGHGLGLEVHESPYIVEGGTEKLRAGMVYTVEPGVYIPSKTGIRIEDDLLVMERGHAILTKELPREYGWWK